MTIGVNKTIVNQLKNMFSKGKTSKKEKDTNWMKN